VKSPNIYYRVTEESILNHAPVLYKIIQDYYRKVVGVASYINDTVFAEDVISDTQDGIGVKTEGVEYDPKMLENDEFKMSVIYHYSMSRGAGVLLTWGEFLVIKSRLEDEMDTVRYETLSLDSNLLKAFNVDPAVIPQDIMSTIMRRDEFARASGFISEEVKKLKSLTDGFADYDRYFEYMKIEVEKIQKRCHEKEYYGTHDLERFTCVCISYRMRFPSFDYLYKISDTRDEVKMSTDEAKNMQAQIAAKIM